MIQAYELKTAYMDNPMGLDDKQPLLSWKVNGAKKQSGFRIYISKNEDEWTLLDECKTDEMEYKCNLLLSSRDRIKWKVALSDENGVYGAYSKESFFEMGLLEDNDWKAKFIMGNYKHSKKPSVRYPVDCFRKIILLKDLKVKQARLYATACGLYEATINGVKVGDAVLTPGSTAFQKRVHYQTFDVTSLLKKENELNLLLADGFYASCTGVFDKAKEYGYEPKIMAQLEVIYEDGTLGCVGTDGSFEWSNDGEIRFADMKNGESIDFNQQPSFSGKALETEYYGLVCASNNDLAKEQEVFTNPKMITCPDGNKVLDFGQNIAGYVSLSLCGEKGKTCRMVCGEKLDENGNFTVKNIAWKSEYDLCHFQSVDFICDGHRHDYKPKFTIMGFRYILLLDWPEVIDSKNFTAVAVYTDMKTTFQFRSSNTLLNQIVQNTFWSVKGNFMDVPTDCPTRERAGWTGDAELFFNTGNYMMDQRAFFRKWIRDVCDCQKENGLVHNINPSADNKSSFIEWISMEGSAGWGDALVAIPYFYWKRYGDDTLIRENWEAMKNCIEFFISRMGKRNLFSVCSPKRSKYDKYLVACGKHFGEWTEPDDCAPSSLSLLFPMAEEATAYLSYATAMMAEMADNLDDVLKIRYDEIAEKSKEAYNYYFVKDGNIDEKRMCKYVRPVGLNLVEKETRAKLLEKIVRLNKDRSYRVGTGFLTTPFVFGALTEAGASDDALKMLLNPEIGWVQQIQNGATTVWENWTDDASLNHYSKGACCQWIFDTVCGVKLDGKKNHFVIAPHLLSEIDSVNFVYDSVYGKVSSGWEKTNNGVRFQMTIPANCTATILLPNQEPFEIEAGDYEYE